MQLISWITTVICLTGTVLNVRKIRSCFLLWLIGNILWLCVDIYNGLWSRAVLDIVQGILALWGIIEWKKES